MLQPVLIQSYSHSSSVPQRVFEAEMLPHMTAVYNFAFTMTHNMDDAKDLVQDTYMKAYRFFDRFAKGTNARAWLFSILKNSYINQYRRTTKEPDKVDFDNIKEFYNTVKSPSTDDNDLQTRMLDNLFDDEVELALRRLPEDFRTVIILSDIEGYNYEEIADFVQIPIGTVRSRLHRARRMLRSMLKSYATNHGFKDRRDKEDQRKA